MCIPHGMGATKSNGFVKEKKKNYKKIVVDEARMKGDPDFEDERTNPLKIEKKEGILDKLASLFNEG